MRRLLLCIWCCWLLVGSAMAQRNGLPTLSADDLRAGDLLFSVNDSGNAITASTSATGDLPIDHVGILSFSGDTPQVLEATTRGGVRATNLAAFLHENPLCVVGRVGKLMVSLSLANARRFLGLPYDSLFEADDSAMYCSELVQKSFVDSTGQRIFPTIPMSFRDHTGHLLPYWEALYRRHGRPVPEGEPGTNPAQLARSPQTRLLGWLRKGKKREDYTLRRATRQKLKIR